MDWVVLRGDGSAVLSDSNGPLRYTKTAALKQAECTSGIAVPLWMAQRVFETDTKALINRIKQLEDDLDKTHGIEWMKDDA